MGIFAKFAAAIVSIPASVFGGMTTYLFASIAISGFRVLSYIHWTRYVSSLVWQRNLTGLGRRNRFILTASMALGLAGIVVPTWFSYV